MKRWLKIAVPLGIAAVMLSVLAIGFGAPSSDAAKPSAEPVTADGCMGDEPERVHFDGRANSTDVYQFDFCSDPNLGLSVGLNWRTEKKDLALRVTEPDGTQHLVDHDVGFTEGYGQAPPLPEGTWTIEVINNGNGAVKYSLNFGFVPVGPQ
jgi:hypothetical protein